MDGCLRGIESFEFSWLDSVELPTARLLSRYVEPPEQDFTPFESQQDIQLHGLRPPKVDATQWGGK